MILTDPPYNVALGQHMRPSEKNSSSAERTAS